MKYKLDDLEELVAEFEECDDAGFRGLLDQAKTIGKVDFVLDPNADSDEGPNEFYKRAGLSPSAQDLLHEWAARLDMLAWELEGMRVALIHLLMSPEDEFMKVIQF